MTQDAGSRLTVTKLFRFSSSFERNEKIHGRNYTLGVVLEGLPEEAEERFEKNMDETLIRRVHSRDLGLHADFLKARDFTDSSLLEAFRPFVRQAAGPAKVRSLWLERDRQTRVTLECTA